MILKIIIEGILLGCLLILFCAAGIRNGAVNMVFLYHRDVQDRCIRSGQITLEQMQRNQRIFKGLGVPVYFIFVVVSAYLVNGVRGFWPGFLNMFAILTIVNLIDRIVIDECWVGHSDDWVIPGTEDMRPYIDTNDKIAKWLLGTIGFALLSALMSAIMMLFL